MKHGQLQCLLPNGIDALRGAFMGSANSGGSAGKVDVSVIYEITARNGLRSIGGQTEGFLESAEPVVDLLEANPDFEPDPDEGTTTLGAIRHQFPAGRYAFDAVAPDGTELS